MPNFILHKPYGYLCQFILVDRKRNKKLLGELYDFPEKTMSIGRLDKQSEGLLLLTTEGKTSFLVNSSKVEKEYYAQVDGVMDEESLQRMCTGVEIGIEGKMYRTKPCRARILSDVPDFLPRTQKIRDDRHGPTSWVAIILREGKYRQVRKMTAAVGFPTLRLMRVRIGNIQLGKMKAGEVIEVENFDLGIKEPNLP